MDGKGRALDNIRIDRFWRSLKWEKLYFEEYTTGTQLRSIINNFMPYYNNVRPHQSLDYKTPSEVYFGNTMAYLAAI